MSFRPLVTAGALALVALATGACRFGFDRLDPASSRNDSGIRPPGDSTINGDAPDSAALFDCKMTHPSAMFCDGFEGPMNEAWGYDVTMNGRDESTTTRAYRGTHALETESYAVDDYKSARWGSFFPQALGTGDLYIRVFYWLTSSTVFADQASLLSSGNGNEPYPSTYVMFTPTDMHLYVDGNTFLFTQGFPRDRWVCVELHIAIDETNGLVELAFDGTTVATAPNTDTLVGVDGYTGVDIGLHYATPAQGPVFLWADEVIADTSPIGCN